MRLDYHNHSTWSSDSTMTLDEALRQCNEVGIDEIAFTEHLDLMSPYDNGPPFHLAPYLEALRHAQNDFPEITVVAGIEAGLNHTNLAATEEFLQQADLDFIITSVHTFAKNNILDQQLAQKLSGVQFLRLYYEEMLHVVERFSLLCVVGHFDYPMRYHPLSEGDLLSCQDIIDEILRTLVRRNAGLEVNLAGYRSIGRQHPCNWILKRFRELGGEIVTIGSDAHHVSQIAMDWDYGAQALMQAGFAGVSRFRNLEIIDVVPWEEME